jgi:hypothetical protein
MLSKPEELLSKLAKVDEQNGRIGSPSGLLQQTREFGVRRRRKHTMEGQRERTSSRRRQRRKSKGARSKVVVEPVLIAARRPDSPLLKNGFVIASAQPKQSNGHRTHGAHRSPVTTLPEGNFSEGDLSEGGRALDGRPFAAEATGNGHLAGELEESHGAAEFTETAASDGAEKPQSEPQRGEGVRRRAVRIVKVASAALTPGNREQQLLDRLVRSQGRGAISRAANDLWEGKFVAPRLQEVQIQLLEHENEQRARDAVFIMAELLQREPPIKRPVLDQRLRRLEQSAEDPITRDAAGALRRSMRVHHGM